MRNETVVRLNGLEERLHAGHGDERDPLMEQIDTLRAEIPDAVRITGEGIETLRAVLIGITTGELAWRQWTWITVHQTPAAEAPRRTYACVAGWLSLIGGASPDLDGINARRSESCVITTDVERPDGATAPVWEEATHALGLDPNDSFVELALDRTLFSGGNSLPDLWGHAEHLTGGVITVPDELRSLVYRGAGYVGAS